MPLCFYHRGFNTHMKARLYKTCLEITSLIGALVVLMGHTTALSATKKIVLIVNSYHAEHPWVQSYNIGLEYSLGSKYNLVSYYMDTKRKPATEFDQITKRTWEKYLALQPAAVVLGDDNALRLIGPKLINKSAQVVYLGINNNPRKYGLLGHSNITGVLERPLIKRSMLMMSYLLPIKKALVIFDDSVTSQVVRREIFNNQNRIKIGDTVIDIALTNDFKDWKSLALKRDGRSQYSALFVGLYHTVTNSESGKHVPAEEVLGWLSEHSTIPLFAFWDFSIGKGLAAGGYVLFGEEQGKAAGDLVLEMLNR